MFYWYSADFVGKIGRRLLKDFCDLGTIETVSMLRKSINGLYVRESQNLRFYMKMVNLEIFKEEFCQEPAKEVFLSRKNCVHK